MRGRGAGSPVVWGAPERDPRSPTNTPPIIPAPVRSLLSHHLRWGQLALPSRSQHCPTAPAGSLKAASEGLAEPRLSRKRPMLGSKWSPWSRTGHRLRNPRLLPSWILPLLLPVDESWGKPSSSPPGSQVGAGTGMENTRGRETDGQMDGWSTWILRHSSLPVLSQLRATAESVPQGTLGSSPEPRGLPGAGGRFGDKP